MFTYIYTVKEVYLEEGYTDYLSKPIIPKELEDMLLALLPSEKVKMVL